MQILAEKISNGEFDKIVEKHIDRLLDSAVSDALTGWNNPLQKTISEKIQEITIGIFHETDFSNYVDTIKYTINKALNETALPQYAEFVKSLQYKLGKKPDEVEFGQKFTVQELFDIYTNYIEESDFSADFAESEPGDEYGTVTANLEIRGGEYYFYTIGRDDDREEEFVFKIGYQGRPEYTPETLLTKRWFNRFEMEIIRLNNRYIQVTDYTDQFDTLSQAVEVYVCE